MILGCRVGVGRITFLSPNTEKRPKTKVVTKPQRKLSIVVRNRKTSLPSLRSYSMPSERVSLSNRNPSILLTRASLEMMDLVNRRLFRQHILDLFSSLIQEGE